jgi:tRNA threonylcarbamoyladenosine biosynthesis protein TsaE
MAETYLCSTQEDLPDVARAIIHENTGCRIFLFTGNLGAGKTALIREMCRVLGYQEEVTSPTFSIVNEYSFDHNTLYHMDLYRLNRIEEALDIGMEDYLYSGQYCFIEWPEVIILLIQESYCHITISVSQDQTRKIDVERVRAS